MWTVPGAANSHVPSPLDERDDDRDLDEARDGPEGDDRPEHEERDRVGEEVGEAGVQERGEGDAEQSTQRTWPHSP